MEHYQHLVRSGVLSEQELKDTQILFDRLCVELPIVSTAARDMAAGLIITMVSNGQRDAGHLRAAIARFATELNGESHAA